MKIRLATLLLVVFLLSGCTTFSPTPFPTVEVPPTEAPTLTPSPEPPTVEPTPTTLPPTSTPTPQPTSTPDEATVQALETWEGVPFIPGAINLQDTGGITLTFTAPYTLEDAVSFYQEKMAELGWDQTYRKDSVDTDLPQTDFDFEKDGSVVRILIIYNPLDETTIFGLKLTKP